MRGGSCHEDTAPGALPYIPVSLFHQGFCATVLVRRTSYHRSLCTLVVEGVWHSLLVFFSWCPFLCWVTGCMRAWQGIVDFLDQLRTRPSWVPDPTGAFLASRVGRQWSRLDCERQPRKVCWKFLPTYEAQRKTRQSINMNKSDATREKEVRYKQGKPTSTDITYLEPMHMTCLVACWVLPRTTPAWPGHQRISKWMLCSCNAHCSHLFWLSGT